MGRGGVAPDRLVQVVELRAGRHVELAQHARGQALVDAHRLGGAARPVQGQDQHPGQVLLQGVAAQGVAQLVGDLLVAPDRDAQGGVLLQHHQTDGLHELAFVVEGRAGQLAEEGAPPQLQGSGERVRRTLLVTALAQVARGVDVGVEQGQVHLVGAGRQSVAAAPVVDADPLVRGQGGQGAAQAGHVLVDEVDGVGGGTGPPDHADDALCGQGLVGVEGQRGEYGLLPGSPQRKDTAAVGDRQFSQDRHGAGHSVVCSVHSGAFPAGFPLASALSDFLRPGVFVTRVPAGPSRGDVRGRCGARARPAR